MQREVLLAAAALFAIAVAEVRAECPRGATQCATEADTDPPTAWFQSVDGPVNGPFRAEIWFSEPVVGLEVRDFAATNGTVSDLAYEGAIPGLGGAVAHSVLVRPEASGMVAVFLEAGSAADAAGNPLGSVDPLRVETDFDPPTVTIRRNPADATGPISGPFEIVFTFSEQVSGFEADDVLVNNGRLLSLEWVWDPERVLPGPAYVATLEPGEGAVLTVTIQAGAATDAAGNPSTAAEWSVDVATPVPALPTVAAVILAAALARRARRMR